MKAGDVVKYRSSRFSPAYKYRVVKIGSFGIVTISRLDRRLGRAVTIDVYEDELMLTEEVMGE